MYANKLTVLILLVCALVVSSCAPENLPTALPAPTIVPIQPDIESKDELIVRMASIISKHPFLIALSEMENESNLWLGVSPEVNGMEKCWIVDTGSVKQCEDEDLRNYIGNPSAPKIFFASVYSTVSLEELIILDYYHPWVEDDLMDGYRLVIEFKDGKWVEKSLTQVY